MLKYKQMFEGLLSSEALSLIMPCTIGEVYLLPCKSVNVSQRQHPDHNPTTVPMTKLVIDLTSHIKQHKESQDTGVNLRVLYKCVCRILRSV